MYYKSLGLTKEPFSTSPDPDFFYNSLSHETALKRLEIAIRLRRGLSLIIGDVGTGKTTLLRTLLRAFKDEPGYEFHILLDPGFKSEYQFLSNLINMFGLEPDLRSTLDFKEALEKHLFEQGVEKNKTIILLIDEGQKISLENLELLRMLLNYETNEYKLLQIVLMPQVELLPRIKRVRNFIDRICLKYTINPLEESETKELIEFRLKQAGLNSSRRIFTDGAIRLIYQEAQGYPRRITMLCHDALELAIMNDACQVDEKMAGSLVTQARRLEPDFNVAAL